MPDTTLRLLAFAALLITANGARCADYANLADGAAIFESQWPESPVRWSSYWDDDVARGEKGVKLASAVSGSAASSCEQCGVADCRCGPSPCHRSSIWVEFLLLHPTGVDMVHAQQQNGTGGTGTVPFGRVGAIDPHHDAGVRFGFNRSINDWSSIAASFTHYESDAVQVVAPPAIAGGGGAVGSLVHHPETQLTGSSGPVDGFYDVKYQLVDLDYRSLWRQWHDGWLNYSIGVRYAHLEQAFLQQGAFGGGFGGAIDTSTLINFDGGGVKLGLDGAKVISSNGISFYGRASAAPMVGQFFSDYQMVNTTTSVDLARAVWNDDRFVTMLDYELGLRWTSASGALQLSVGYLAQFWYNAVTTPEFVDAVQADNYVDLGDTISFDGIVTRLEARW